MFQVPAHTRNVNIELDLVSVGIGDVEAVAHGVIAHADHMHAGLLATTHGVAQFVVRVADLEPEVIEADVASARQRLRVLAHLDEQQFVMRPAAAEQRYGDPAEGTVLRGSQLPPAEHVSIEGGRALDVVDVQDEVSQLFDLHGKKLTRGVSSQTGGVRRHRAAWLSDDGRVRGVRISYPQIIGLIYVVAMFMTIMDATIVYVALPSIARSFAVSPAATDGVIVGYLVSLAVWIPASGWVGDRYGTKRTFLTAVALFTIASALCGLSQSLLELVLFRVLQGAGGGMLTPVGMAMLYRAYPPAQRARLARILVIPTVMAPALGPLIGGELVDSLSWRWVFFVNVPIGLAAVVFSGLKLTEHRERAGERFDLPGFCLAAGGFGLFLFALSEAATLGWASPLIIATAAGGAALIAALVWVELHADLPMIDLRLLRNRLFGVANLASLFASGGFLGLLFLAPIWLQSGRGLSALVSGSSTAPEALGVLVSSQLVGRIYPRVGPRRLISGGLAGVTIATCLLAVLMDGNLWLFRGVMFTIGVGWAYVVISMNAGLFAQVSPRETGRATALYNAQRQLAAALGVATLSTIVGTQEAATGLAGDATVFRIAFFAAAGFTFVGAVIALAIRDRDAASTMRRDAPPTTAAPAA